MSKFRHGMDWETLGGLSVAVHWNFKGKHWSVTVTERGHPLRGKVVLWSDTVALIDAYPKVSAAGRERVRREGVKNVHARIHGAICVPSAAVYAIARTSQEVCYNPYTMEGFQYREGGARFRGTFAAHFTEKGKVWVSEEERWLLP